MRRLILPLLLSLWAVPSLAQRPAVHTTIKATDTTASSLLVGCAFGASIGCTGGINSGPIVVNTGGINIVDNVPGVTTMKLYNNAGTLTWNGAPLAVGSSVSGTVQRIPFFTAANAIGDSIMIQDVGATTITLSGLLATTTLTVSSTAAITGVATFTAAPVLSSTTASLPVFTDGSKSLVSNAITGTGSVVMSTSPTMVTPTLGNATATKVITGASGWTVLSAGDGVDGAYFATNTDFSNLSTINQPAMRMLGDGTNPFNIQTSPATAVSGARTWTTRMRLSEAGSLRLHAYGAGVAEFDATGIVTSVTTLSNTVQDNITRLGTIGVAAIFGSTVRFNGNLLNSSGNIMDSMGTPSCGSGCTVDAGRDYAFSLSGMSSGVNAVINFGTTWTNPPICVATSIDATGNDVHTVVSTTTTVLTINSIAASPGNANVVCRGY